MCTNLYPTNNIFHYPFIHLAVLSCYHHYHLLNIVSEIDCYHRSILTFNRGHEVSSIFLHSSIFTLSSPSRFLGQLDSILLNNPSFIRPSAKCPSITVHNVHWLNLKLLNHFTHFRISDSRLTSRVQGYGTIYQGRKIGVSSTETMYFLWVKAQLYVVPR